MFGDARIGAEVIIDCLGSGTGPRRPGSGPDRPHRSECLGQCKGGPDLEVGPGPDLDQTFIFIVQVVVSTVFISMVNILLNDISL